MQENDTTETPVKTPPDLRFKPNDWAVASAAQNLLGKLTPNAFAVAVALAGHVDYQGAHFRVWPSYRRLMSMCGIASLATVSRALAELGQHRLIRVSKDRGRRKSCLYLLQYVTLPARLEGKKLRLVDSTDTPPSVTETVTLRKGCAKAVEKPPLSVTETVALSVTETVTEVLPSKSLQEEEERGESEGERGRHDPSPRIDLKTIDSHPLSSAFEDKSTHIQKAKAEILNPVAEAKRKADYKALWDVSGPRARSHLEKTERERDLLSSKNAQDGLGDAETQLTH